MSLNPLEQSIVKTLAYFDVFNFPLTAEELFRYLWIPPRMGYLEFMQYVRTAKACENAKIYCKYGYFFLPGREEIVEDRRRASVSSAQKMARAKKAVKLIRSVPFLKSVFVCNSVAAEVAKEGSDIDLFIIAEQNRIWLVRLFSNLIFLLIGWRRRGGKIAHRLCLSFYVDTAHLNMEPLLIDKDDIYMTYWVHQIVPLYDPDNYYASFLKANQWTSKFLPNISRVNGSVSLPKGGVIGRGWKKAWETMWKGNYGILIENEAKKVQLTKMKRAADAQSSGNSGVVVRDGVLKFHEKDRRAEFRDRWLENIKKFGNTEIQK